MERQKELGISRSRPAVRIALRAPVIIMVLAATAIPVELLPQGHNTIDVGIKTADALANILGYLPVGIVLGELGLLRAIIVAALMAILAESSQLVMMHRDPSVIDVASNVIGALLGVTIRAVWKIRSPGLTINNWTALTAAALAVTLVLGVWATSSAAVNTRGATQAGTLEAHWTFDESGGRAIMDSSGHDLRGRFSQAPARVTGVMGRAVKLSGAADYLYFGHPSAFRLVGSMTVSAWIKSTSYPADDAAIVSTLKHIIGGNDFGFQLDTTIDRGPRTIGFKLADACGDLMARYGATPLRLDTWYHLAGVYDAEAETIDVYLNGELDNGFLEGHVRGARRSSREALYIGRRSDAEEYPFTGVVDDVRLYSLALTKAEVTAVMRGTDVRRLGPQATKTDFDLSRSESRPRDRQMCEWSSEFEDARVPGAVAVLGALVALTCIGLWPSAPVRLCLVVSFLAGWLLLLVASGTLPSLNRWTFPLTSLAGGASVVVSSRRRTGLVQ